MHQVKKCNLECKPMSTIENLIALIYKVLLSHTSVSFTYLKPQFIGSIDFVLYLMLPLLSLVLLVHVKQLPVQSMLAHMLD